MGENIVVIESDGFLFAPSLVDRYGKVLQYDQKESLTVPTIEEVVKFGEAITKSPEAILSLLSTFGIGGEAAVWGLLRIGVESGKLSQDFLTTLTKIFPTLSHSSNMAGSVLAMGITVITGEKLAMLAKTPENQEKIRATTTVVGGLATAALQLYLESRKFMMTDVPDFSGDAVFGLLMITPGYFAARYLLRHKSVLKDDVLLGTIKGIREKS